MWSCEVAAKAEERLDIEHMTKKECSLYNIIGCSSNKEAKDERVRGVVHEYYWWIKCDDNRKLPIITSPPCIMALV
jgi:hypothetical protein